MKLVLNKIRHFNEPGAATEPILQKNVDDKHNWFLEETGEIYNRFDELQDQAEANTLPMLLEAATNGYRLIQTINKEDAEPIDLEDMPLTSGQRQAKADAMIAEITKKENEYKDAIKKYWDAKKAAEAAKKEEPKKEEPKKEEPKKGEPTNAK